MSRSAVSTSVSHEINKYVRWCLATGTSPRVSEIAATLGISRSTITIRFHEESGNTIGAHLRRLHIEFAKQVLLTSNQPFWAIAHSTGFGSERSFYRTFKQITGKTPGSFRKSEGSSRDKMSLDILTG